MKSFYLILALLSLPAFAGTRVQFDVEAYAIDSQSTTVDIYKHTYEAEFQPADNETKIAFSEVLTFRDKLPLKRISTGEKIDIGFGLVIMRLNTPAADGKEYNVDFDFGPGQPINGHTRWGTTYLRSLESFVGLSVNGEQIKYPKKAIVAPVLRIRNFKFLNP